MQNSGIFLLFHTYIFGQKCLVPPKLTEFLRLCQLYNYFYFRILFCITGQFFAQLGQALLKRRPGLEKWNFGNCWKGVLRAVFRFCRSTNTIENCWVWQTTKSLGEPDTSATRHFGIKTLWDTSAPQNWCRSLRRMTGGAVSHGNCPGSKCPGFSSITALVSKCLVPRFWCRSVLGPVPKCPRVSWCRSVLWLKCPVTEFGLRPILSKLT